MSKKMTKNIVDAYRKAVSKSKKDNFHDVISFCENDKKCREDNSLKKNVLMYWSYKKIAMFYEKGKKYRQAYEFWQKALSFAKKYETKIKIGHKLLELINKMRLPMDKKAGEIIKVTEYMQKEYELKGNKESVLRISKLQDAAEKLLKKSKALH